METHLPPKKKKVLLGVGDPKIGAAIQEELGYNCQTGVVIAEILRGPAFFKSGSGGAGGGVWKPSRLLFRSPPACLVPVHAGASPEPLLTHSLALF